MLSTQPMHLFKQRPARHVVQDTLPEVPVTIMNNETAA